jgi:uncharacterized Fe-S center protein
MAADNYIPEGTPCDECGQRDAVYQWWNSETNELLDLCAECRKAMDDD